MSGPIVRRYGFPNFEKIFGDRGLQHGVDDEAETTPGADQSAPTEAPGAPQSQDQARPGAPTKGEKTSTPGNVK